MTAEYDRCINHAQSLSALESKYQTLKDTVDRDHARLEKAIHEATELNKRQEERIGDAMERINQYSLKMAEVSEMAGTLSQVATEVNYIKRDMERSAGTKKDTVQHIMSIVGPIITAALILWLGLS